MSDSLLPLPDRRNDGIQRGMRGVSAEMHLWDMGVGWGGGGVNTNAGELERRWRVEQPESSLPDQTRIPRVHCSLW